MFVSLIRPNVLKTAMLYFRIYILTFFGTLSEKCQGHPWIVMKEKKLKFLIIFLLLLGKNNEAILLKQILLIFPHKKTSA